MRVSRDLQEGLAVYEHGAACMKPWLPHPLNVIRQHVALNCNLLHNQQCDVHLLPSMDTA